MNRIKMPKRILRGIIGVLVVWVLVGAGIVSAVVSTQIVEEPLGENSAQTIVGDEVVGLRTETSKTYYLGESTYAVEAALWPVHYQDEGWQEIDNAWVPATAPWNWEMVQDSYHAYVLNQFTYGQILKFELEGESVAFQPMELQWTNDLSMIQTISMTQDVLVEVTNEPTELLTGMEGSIGSIRWNNAYGSGRHFEFTTTSGKLQTLLQLDAAPPKPLEYIITGGNPVMKQSFIFDPSIDLDIYVNNVTWDKKTKVQTVENIEFRLDGETVWYFWQARYWDSGNSTEVATTILRKDGNDLWLDVLVPYEWLQTAVYPIFIDPDTGATYPGLGSNEDRDGKTAWTTPTNIQAEANSATNAILTLTYSDWLRASQFGFAIPSTATIVGIVAEIHRRGEVANKVFDSALFLVDENGDNVGDDQKSSDFYPTTAAAKTYGSSTNLWGATPTPTMVNDANFGVRLSCGHIDTSTRSAYVYWVKSTVYYTLPEPPTVTTSACSDATASSLQANGEITDDGGLTVTRRGFVHAEGLKYALDFNGSSDQVDIPEDNVFDTAGELAVELWYKTAASMTSVGLLVHDFSDWKYVAPYITTGSASLSFYVQTSTGVSSCTWNGGAAIIADGDWHHVACVYDKALSSQRLKLYFDGVLEASATGYAEDILAGDEGLTIGRYSSNFFEGTIDDIRIWNDARTQDEIQANMYSELVGTEAGLVGYWKLNEGADTTAEDSTANENDGTITGADWVYQGWDLWLMKDDISQAEYDTAQKLYSGSVTRRGQKVPVLNGYVDSLSFYLNKSGSPSGDVTFTVRDLADNVLATKVLGDASTLQAAATLEEAAFTTPIFVNEWVRISVEYSGGDASNYVVFNLKSSDLTPIGYSTRYWGTWADDTGLDCAYVLGYTPYTYEDGSFAEGVYDLTIEGLIAATNYRVRAFAENSAGRGYGDVVTCQTAAGYSFGVVIG